MIYLVVSGNILQGIMGTKHIKKYFTKELQEQVVSDYLIIKSIKKLSVKYKITTRQITNILNDNNIEHKKIRKTSLDETYFDNHNDDVIGPNVMYWAGFIASDGNVMNKTESRSYSMTVRLSVKDIDHLYKLQNSLKSTAKIRTHKNKTGFILNKPCKETESCVVSFSSKYLVNSLQYFNIVPAKSKIYDIPKYLYTHRFINHLIRGYMDGDGCVMFHNKYKRISFYGTKECLESISEIIWQNCHINKRAVSKNRTIYSTQYNGNDAITLLKWIYKGANIYLDRKHELIQHII
jgi:hypothetical protein